MQSDRKPICNEPLLRERMAARKIDLLLASSRRNVAYFTDHQTAEWNWEHAILHMMEKEYDGWDYLLFAGFPLEASKGSFLVEYAHREQAIRRRGLFADAFYGYWRAGRRVSPDGPGVCLEQEWTRTPEESAAQAIRDRSLDSAVIGVEMPRISAAVLDQLRELLPKARFVDAFDLLLDVRQYKTDEELRRLRRAYNTASAVYREALKHLRIGVTPREILLREMQSIYSTDCSFSFAHVFFGSGGQDIAYTPPPDRPIRAGDIGVLDLGVVYEGYGTDYARMAQVPPAHAELTRLFPTILEARRTVERMLKPGAKARDIFLAGARRLEEDGLCASISDVGHGIGLECHERPFLTPYSDDVIAAGQTVVIEIYCEVKGIGPVLLEDGGLVTPDGWQSFSDLSTDLITVAN